MDILKKLQRYDFDSEAQADEWLDPDDCGEWVRFDDVVEAIIEYEDNMREVIHGL